VRIIFINPPIWQRGAHFRLNRGLAAPQLITVLRKAGHEASYLDAEAIGATGDNVAQYLREEAFDVVACTVLYHNRESCQEVAELAHRLLPKARVIAGGPHATACPEEVLEWADAVCLGEGEGRIGELVANRDLRGAREGSFIDMAALPLPGHEHCYPPFSWYIGNEPRYVQPGQEAVSLWTRGCPHSCVFCSHPVFGHQCTRRMPVPRVLEEVNYLMRFGIRHIFVYSDELVGDSKTGDRWLEEVCQEIAPLGLSYKTQGRCSTHIQLNTLEAMKAAGFRAVMWGVESFSEKVLKAMNKGTTLEDIWQTLQKSKLAGLQNWVFLMVAGPGEGQEDFQLSVKGLQEAKRAGLVDFGQVSIMMLEPGAPLYAQAKAEGWIPDNRPSRSHFSGYLNLPWASPAEQNRRRDILAEVLAK